MKKEKKQSENIVGNVGRTGSKAGWGWIILIGAIVGGILLFILFKWIIATIGWLWLIGGVLLLLLIAYLIMRLIKGGAPSFGSFSLPRYRTLGRWTINLFRLMGVVGAAFLIFYIVTATKAWSGGVVDRVLHPMKDRGEVAANCVTCNTETKVDKLTQGKVIFKKGDDLDFERKFSVARRYKLVDGQKEAILTITSPTHTWKVMVTPEGDYLESGTPDPVAGWCKIKCDRNAVIKVTYVQ